MAKIAGAPMTQYLVNRLLGVVLTLFIVMTGVFFLMRYLPGDLATLRAGEGVYTRVQLQSIRHQFGLDKSLPEQLGDYYGQVFRGRLGTSAWTGRSVTQELQHRAPVTVELGLIAMVLATCAGVVIGCLSATMRNSPADYVMRTVSVLGMSVPSFWLGTMVVVLPSIWFGWSVPLHYKALTDDPVGNIKHVLAPAIILALTLAAVTARFCRTMLLEVLRQDFVRTAYAKGLRQRTVLIRHAVRNAAAPVVTVIGLQAPILIGGAVLIEGIFNLPGLGTLMFQSLEKRDYPMIQGLNVIFAAVVILTNLVVDLLYNYLDPRLRVAK